MRYIIPGLKIKQFKVTIPLVMKTIIIMLKGH